MLRRKLLLTLGSLVGLMVIMAVTAVWLLQGVLGDLNHVHKQALVTVEKVNQLTSAIAVIQTQLYELQMGRERHLDMLIASVEVMRQNVADVGKDYIVHEQPAEAGYDRLVKQLPLFERYVGLLATVEDPELSREQNQLALTAAVTMDKDILELSRYVRQHAQAEQEALTARFRWLVLGLAIAFLLLINVSIIVLLRTAEMILKPVDKLVEASEELGLEHFDHRVTLDGNDE